MKKLKKNWWSGDNENNLQNRWKLSKSVDFVEDKKGNTK